MTDVVVTGPVWAAPSWPTSFATNWPENTKFPSSSSRFASASPSRRSARRRFRGCPEGRPHDRIHGHADGPQNWPAGRGNGTRRRVHGTRPASPISANPARLRGAAANSAAQPQLVVLRQIVHTAKVGFETYFLHKIRTEKSEPFYERLALQVLGMDKLKRKSRSRRTWACPAPGRDPPCAARFSR